VEAIDRGADDGPPARGQHGAEFVREHRLSSCVRTVDRDSHGMRHKRPVDEIGQLLDCNGANVNS
jgi:hypothetical protein